MMTDKASAEQPQSAHRLLAARMIAVQVFEIIMFAIVLIFGTPPVVSDTSQVSYHPRRDALIVLLSAFAFLYLCSRNQRLWVRVLKAGCYGTILALVLYLYRSRAG